MQFVSTLTKKMCGVALCALFAGSAIASDPVSAAVAKPKPAPDSKTQLKGVLYELRLPTVNATLSKEQTKAKTKSKSKTEGEATAYLLVSIHVAKSDFYPMSPQVRKAYSRADTLAVEVDLTDDKANQSNIAKLSYVAPDKLQDHLTGKTWDALTGLTGEAVQRFQSYKPVVVAMGLTISAGINAGFDPAQNIDAHYLNAAKEDKKTIVQLVGVEYQGDVLAGLSDAEGDAILASTLESFRNGEVGSEFKKLERAWKNGDAEALTILTDAASNKDVGSKSMMKKLMDERNPDIAIKLKQAMQEGKKLFIVLGAGHFAGENNLLLELQKQGLDPKQVR
jgi:hypothetical protein